MACFRVGITLWVMVFSYLFSMGTALADEQSVDEQSEQVDVAVFELTGDGVDDDLLETFSSILRQEAQQHAGYSLANPAAIRRDEIALVVGCDPDGVDCLRQMADYVDGQVLIFGDVAQDGTKLSVTIEILETDAGEEPIRVERTIEDSTDPVVSFRQKVEAVFSDLGAVAKTHLVVESPESEMEIRLDGEVVGRGLVERQGLSPGLYQLTVGDDPEPVWDGEVKLETGQLVEIRPQLDDDDKETSTVAEERSALEVGDDTAASLRVERRQGSPETPDVAPRALVGIGVAALVGSGFMVFQMRDARGQLVAEREQGSISDERYRELTRRSQRYENAHYALFGLGAVAMGAGVGWAIWDHRRGKGEETDGDSQVVVKPTGWGVAIFGNW